MDLRRTLFLEPAPSEDYVKAFNRPSEPLQGYYCGLQAPQYIEPKPIQCGYIIVEAHPLLTSLEYPTKAIPVDRNGRLCPPEYKLPYDATHKVLCITVDSAPASALVFQPPPPIVGVYYIYQRVLVEHTKGGVTFGAVREEIDRQRKECQEMIDDLAKRDWTPEKRKKLKAGMRRLKCIYPCKKSSRYFTDSGEERDPHERDLSEPCVFLKVLCVGQDEEPLYQSN